MPPPSTLPFTAHKLLLLLLLMPKGAVSSSTGSELDLGGGSEWDGSVVTCDA